MAWTVFIIMMNTTSSFNLKLMNKDTMLCKDRGIFFFALFKLYSRCFPLILIEQRRVPHRSWCMIANLEGNEVEKNHPSESDLPHHQKIAPQFHYYSKLRPQASWLSESHTWVQTLERYNNVSLMSFSPSLVPSTFTLSLTYVKWSPTIFPEFELIPIFCNSLRLVLRINSQRHPQLLSK